MQFLLFAGLGAVGTFVHYAVLLVSVQVLAAHPVTGSVCGYAAGALVNFALSHHIAFRSKARVLETGPRFFAVAITGLLITWFTMWSLVEQIGVQYLLAQVVATALVLGCNYVANALWTFGGQRRGE